MEPLWGQGFQPIEIISRARSGSRKGKQCGAGRESAKRLVEIGQGTPEYRLIIGKAHYNRGEYDDACGTEAAVR